MKRVAMFGILSASKQSASAVEACGRMNRRSTVFELVVEIVHMVSRLVGRVVLILLTWRGRWTRQQEKLHSSLLTCSTSSGRQRVVDEI